MYREQLYAKMVACEIVVKKLLARIDILETDEKLSVNEKLVQIKIIKEEMIKVGTEIDTIKRELTLLNACNLN